MKPSGIITLMTDFGLRDPYVAMIKGVILSINPEAKVIDIRETVPVKTDNSLVSFLSSLNPSKQAFFQLLRS